MQHTKCHTDVERVELKLFLSTEPQTTAALMVCLEGNVWNVAVLRLTDSVYSFIYVCHVLFCLHMFVLSDIK